MAGVKVGVGYIDIRPDLKGFGRELQTGVTRNVKTAGDDASRTLKSSFADAAKGAAAAFGAAFAAVRISDFIGSAIQAASGLEEAGNKVSVVFDDSAGTIKRWADTAATSIGQSELQALQAAGTFGNLFVSMGLGTDTAADMSIALVDLASDLASFNDILPTEALDALRSGLVGETEPMRRLGVNMNEATLKAKALELGLIGTTKEALEPAAKAQAAYALIFEQTATAQGDFARTADSLANQQRIMTAQWADAKAELGEGLLPLMTDLAGVINDSLIPAFKTLFLSSDADASGWAATLRDVIGDTVGFVLGAFAELARGTANLIGAIPGNVGEGVIQNLRDTADAADEARVRLHASTGELLLWNAAADSAEGAASRFAAATRGILPELDGLAGGTKEAASALREQDKAARDAASAERDLEDAKRDYNKLLKEGAVNEEKVADARERLDDATRSLNKANRDLARAQEDYNDAQAAYLALPIDTNADKLRDASDGLADAKDGVADATARQKDAEAELAKEKAGDPDYQDKLADAKDRVADAQDKLAETSDAMAAGAKKAATEQKALNGELKITKEEIGEILNLARAIDAPAAPGLPPVGVPTVPTVGFSSSPGSFGPSVPTVSYQPAPTAPTKSVTINQTFTEPQMDPGLIGKAIAWVL